MAKDKNEPTDDAIVDALESASPERLRAILAKAGAVPTTIGMTPEAMREFMGGFAAVNADTMQRTMRANRKENPNYPERSVFFPEGKFDDDGKALRAKRMFRRRTYHNNVLLGGELETEEEIDLFNAITEDRSARDGQWKAEVLDKGTARERVMVTTPSLTPDERTNNPEPLAMKLREILGGPEAVNQGTMAKRLAELEAKMAQQEAVSA